MAVPINVSTTMQGLALGKSMRRRDPSKVMSVSDTNDMDYAKRQGDRNGSEGCALNHSGICITGSTTLKTRLAMFVSEAHVNQVSRYPDISRYSTHQ
jgi:hypothetical protein